MKRLARLIPDEALPLFSAGLITLQSDSTGPAPAWTEWAESERVFKIHILDRLDQEMSDDQLANLIEHEMNHIACGHFRQKCHAPCSLISADVEANWWLERDGRLDEMQTDINRVLDTKDGKCITPSEWLTKLKLNPKRVYRAEVVHKFLHDELEEMLQGMGQDGDGSGCADGMCGGITETQDGRAAAIGVATAASMPEAGESAVWGGKMYGSNPGDGEYAYKAKPVPPWAKKMMDFARAVVERCLGEGRKHSRPVQSLRQAGIHVPARKPRWDHKPKTACILVDTSGSMYCDDILSYLAAAVAYLRQHKITVRVIACDTRVNYDEILTNGFPAKIPGGGGTDIIPLFDRAREHKAEAVICVTDGYVPSWPEGSKYDFDTLFVVPENCTPPFGTVAHYKEGT